MQIPIWILVQNMRPHCAQGCICVTHGEQTVVVHHVSLCCVLSLCMMFYMLVASICGVTVVFGVRQRARIKLPWFRGCCHRGVEPFVSKADKLRCKCWSKKRILDLGICISCLLKFLIWITVVGYRTKTDASRDQNHELWSSCGL